MIRLSAGMPTEAVSNSRCQSVIVALDVKDNPEFSGMRELQRYFKEERQVAREDLYISSYWKCGSSEDQHKVVKRQDSETFGE